MRHNNFLPWSTPMREAIPTRQQPPRVCTRSSSQKSIQTVWPLTGLAFPVTFAIPAHTARAPPTLSSFLLDGATWREAPCPSLPTALASAVDAWLRRGLLHALATVPTSASPRSHPTSASPRSHPVRRLQLIPAPISYPFRCGPWPLVLVNPADRPDSATKVTKRPGSSASAWRRSSPR